MLSASLCRSLPNSTVLRIPVFVRWKLRVGGKGYLDRCGKRGSGWVGGKIEADGYLSSGISHKHEGIDCAIVYYFHYGLLWLGNFILELGYRIWEFSVLIQLRHILRENSRYPKGVRNTQIAGICWWKHRGVVYQCIGVTVQWKVVGSLVEPTCVNWHRICWWLWIWLFSPKPLHKNAGKIPFSLL